MKRGLILFLCGAMAAPSADLPVRTVVLYKHGIGFFEREGTLGPGESARLDFNAADMNDVLKSLTIQERGGGKVSGLRYDSQEPLDEKLKQFPFEIGAAMPMSGALDQLKGARIEIKLGSETLVGIIVSAHAQQIGFSKTDSDQMTLLLSNGQPQREQVTLMLDNGEWRNVDLSAATSVRLTDPQLQKQFQEYFAAIAASRSKDKRSVYIDSTDAKQRVVDASYTIPTAVWKSSYRLIFGGDPKPTLEGWAIVDNTTGEDWTNVNLSLVSGRPISFVSQLYAPKFIQRPTAELPDDAAAAPVVHSGSIGGGIGSGSGGGVGGAPYYARKAAAPPPPPAPMSAPAQSEISFNGAVRGAEPSLVSATATGAELGELFEYRIGHPVTIKKSESAMLPFLQQAIDARKLLIYTASGSEHPTNAAELTNSTGKTLDGGPITIYDGGAYGGEALMETLKAGDKRLISYAVDLGTRITTRYGSSASVTREVHFNRGILTDLLAATETRTYSIRNVDQKAKTLIIEHNARPGYTLVNLTPKEKTATAYRFEVDLKPDSTQEFRVPEEHIYNQSYSVASMTPDALLAYVANKTLSEAAKRGLQQIADEKQQIADNDRAIQDTQSQIGSLTQDEERIRQNIQSLNSVSGQQQQVQNYARQLDQHEQQLATLWDKQAELQKKKSALAAEMERLVGALTF